MNTIRISELPNAESLNSSDLVPIVQDGVTKHATVNLMRVDVDSALSTSSANPVRNSAIATALNNKVNKVSGKGLSANDFTDAYKTKLDGIELNANNYTLPTASSSTLGGIKVGTNLQINSGVLTAKLYTPNDSDGGGAIGSGASANSGFAGGHSASATNGGAVGFSASATLGGAVGASSGETEGGGAVGFNAHTTKGGAVGYNSYTTTGASIGYNAYSAGGGAVGDGAIAEKGAAVGLNAVCGSSQNPIDAVQLGTGTNLVPNTLQVYTHRLLDSAGYIPSARLPTASDSMLGGVYVDTSLDSSSGNPVTNSAVTTAINASITQPRIAKLIVYDDYFDGDADKNWIICDYNGNAIVHLKRKGKGGSLTSANISNIPSGIKWASDQTVYFTGSDNATYRLDLEAGHHAMTIRHQTSGTSFTADFDFEYTGFVNVKFG